VGILALFGDVGGRSCFVLQELKASAEAELVA
jgi:hypothetical protein